MEDLQMTQNGNGMKPKVDLALNSEAKLTLTKDKCYEGTNAYGAYYLYSVEDEGEGKSFFATPEVHQQILESGIRTGDQFLIRKKAVQNGRKVMAKVEFEVISKQPSPPSHGNGHSDDFKALMKACVAEAVEITKEVNTIPWQNEDVRSIALTMFIQRARLN
jgi:hypothetical protein